MKVAILLSGCGFLDGAEIQESVLCLLKLHQEKMAYQCFAPNMLQKKVVNHCTQKESSEERNVLIESARIARGNVLDIEELNVESYDALLLPGGFGVATTFSDFVDKGDKSSLLPVVEKVIQDFFKHKKAIGATCIAPAIVAKALEGMARVKITLGQGTEPAQLLEKMGMEAVYTRANEYTSDTTHRIYTTAAYMEETDPAEMFEGIQGVIEGLKSCQ